MLASIKEDYTALSKAVAYYLDHDHSAIYDEEELKKISSLMSIDEIHIFDESGTIISSTIPAYVGYSFDSGEQMAYFKPMLSDRTLSMCQDITPNTADNKPMVYAITWNEAQNKMIEVGIEPVRLLNELSANELQDTVADMPMNRFSSIVIADRSTLEIAAATANECNGKKLSEICGIDPDSIGERTFIPSCRFNGDSGHYYCSATLNDEYYFMVFLRHFAFIDRSLESLFIIFVYLLSAFFFIMKIFKRLLVSQEEVSEHIQIFQSMSEIYYSLHLADLENNTAIEYSARNQVKDNFDESMKEKADEAMIKIMHATMSDEYLERALKFTDIHTLSQRMKGKKIISKELLGKNVGWIRMSFITITEKDGYPQKVVIATQIIDEEKRLTESLYEKSHIDELTKCYNRRAYNNDILTYMNFSDDKDFVYLSLDLNGLKTVNDDIGHEAGDELIRGAVDCINKAFANYGKIYRVGGDEFAALLFVDGEKMKELCLDFDRALNEWHGRHVKNVSVSYGYIYSGDARGKSIKEIANMSDRKMYDSKAKYYKEHGIERRRT